MYAARYGLRTGLIEQMMGGAQIINLGKIVGAPSQPVNEANREGAWTQGTGACWDCRSARVTGLASPLQSLAVIG